MQVRCRMPIQHALNRHTDENTCNHHPILYNECNQLDTAVPLTSIFGDFKTMRLKR